MKQLLFVKRSSFIWTRLSWYSKATNTTTSTINPEQVDITIAGGGLVGSAMALALASSPILKEKKILLLESQKKLPTVKQSQPYSNRVCALNQQSISLFERFGAWDLMKSIRVQKVSRMQVWDACSESLITFDDQSLAYIVENDLIQYGLMETLKKSKVDVRLNARVKRFETDSNGIQVQLSDESQPIRTKLLIAADGYQSSIREMARISVMQWSYDQVGIVATLKLDDSITSSSNDNYVAWQRFLPTGPIACLPLNRTHSSLVWTVPKSMEKRLLSISDEQFVDEVNQAFISDNNKQPVITSLNDRLRSFWQRIYPTSSSGFQYPPTVINIEPKSRAAFPLSLLNANQYVRPHLALIGDAAHRIHPMAGQGVNMGFSDVDCLLDVLERAVRDGADLSSLTYLIDYERQRQAKSLGRLLAIDSLNRLYSTKFSPIVALRSIGLSFVNDIYPLKSFFAKQAASGA